VNTGSFPVQFDSNNIKNESKLQADGNNLTHLKNKPPNQNSSSTNKKIYLKKAKFRDSIVMSTSPPASFDSNSKSDNPMLFTVMKKSPGPKKIYLKKVKSGRFPVPFDSNSIIYGGISTTEGNDLTHIKNEPVIQMSSGTNKMRSPMTTLEINSITDNPMLSNLMKKSPGPKKTYLKKAKSARFP